MFCSFTLQHLILLQIKPTEISSFSLAILNKLDRNPSCQHNNLLRFHDDMKAEVRAGISLQLGVVIYDFRQSNQRRMDLTISQIADKLNQALDSICFVCLTTL